MQCPLEQNVQCLVPLYPLNFDVVSLRYVGCQSNIGTAVFFYARAHARSISECKYSGLQQLYALSNFHRIHNDADGSGSSISCVVSWSRCQAAWESAAWPHDVPRSLSARSRAWSIENTVSTPKMTGVDVFNCTSRRAFVMAWAMTSM